LKQKNDFKSINSIKGTYFEEKGKELMSPSLAEYAVFTLNPYTREKFARF